MFQNKTMINKNVEDIVYKDIQLLLENKIDESDTLDYKTGKIDDSNLMKHVCAFANTRGGDLIFGVKESGDGRFPIEIIGLDESDISKERTEQIILSNIVPRLEIKIKFIKIPDSIKSILLIRIPDSYLKPHQNNMNKKFYKRFQSESAEMTEQEICDCYRRRFTNHDQVEQYIEKILNYKTGLIPTDIIKINLIIIPSNIENRLIETSDYDKFDWFRSIKLHPSTNYASWNYFIPSALKPFALGLISEESDPYKFVQTSIHRNGCIQHIQHFGDKTQDGIQFPHIYFAVKLMQTIQFAHNVLEHYNYFGDVKIIASINCISKNMLELKSYSPSKYIIDKIDCVVKREYSLEYVKTNHDKISSSIMDEIFNHYGFPRCDLFDEDGRIIGSCF